jgi:hypothetical protein
LRLNLLHQKFIFDSRCGILLLGGCNCFFLFIVFFSIACNPSMLICRKQFVAALVLLNTLKCDTLPTVGRDNALYGLQQ